MAQLYAQASQQGIWMALGPPQSCSFALAQALTVTYGDGTQDTLSAHVPAVTSAGTTQVDRTGAVWLLYVVARDSTLRIVREMDQGQIAGSYAPLARVLADRVVPYQPDNGQAQSSTSGQSFLPLTITNQSSTQSIGGSVVVPVPTTSTDYVVQCQLSGSTAIQVWNALSDKTSFSDLQVIFGGAEIDADIDQVTNGAWSSSNITLWFRLQRSIAASGTDQGYQLRMGGGLRPVPKRSWANIYPFSDDFGGSSLSGGWTVFGSPPIAVSSSIVQVSSTTTAANQLIKSSTTFGTGYEARYWALLPANTDTGVHSQSMVGLGVGPAHPDLEVFSAGSAVYYGLDNATTTIGTLGPAPDGAYHCYTVARAQDSSGSAYFSAAGTSAGPITSNTSTAALGLMIWPFRDFAGTTDVSVFVDWVKVRPFVSAEPTVSAGALQSAGGLRWEPVVALDGTLLVTSDGSPLMAFVAST